MDWKLDAAMEKQYDFREETLKVVSKFASTLNTFLKSNSETAIENVRFAHLYSFLIARSIDYSKLSFAN